MANPILPKGYLASAVTTQFQLVKFGAADNACTPITGVTDQILGVAQDPCVAADVGKRVINVMVEGISEVIYGGTVTRGDRLKTTATGTVIAVTTDADKIVGVAQTSGVINDRGQMLITPSAQRGTA